MLEKQYPKIEASYDPSLIYTSQLLSLNKDITYIVNVENQYYGIVKCKSDSSYVIVGPVFNNILHKDTLRNIMKDAAIAQSYESELGNFMNTIPHMDVIQFFHLMSLLYPEINDEEIDFMDFYNNEIYSTINEMTSTQVSISVEWKENDYIHNTYQNEQYLLSSIEKGDMIGLKKLLVNYTAPALNSLSDNALRNTKNIFKIMVALVSRCSIKGGLNPDISFQMSTAYIREAEKLQNIASINLSVQCYSIIQNMWLIADVQTIYLAN